MTIIIGAYLDDGRRIIMADGRGMKGVVITESSAIKAVQLENRVTHRKAAFGIAGTAAAKHIFESVLTRMLAAPGSIAEDLFVRLNERFRELNITPDLEAVVWFDDKLYTLDTALHVKEVVDYKFDFAGTGADHAQGALLGSALRTEAPSKWMPSAYDVDIAYDVAVAMCSNCGGKKTIVLL